MDHPVIARILEKLESRGLLPLEKQAALEETLLEERLALLPDLMKETGLDCWLVLAQENNEDPAMKALMTWDRRTEHLIQLTTQQRHLPAGAVGFQRLPAELCRTVRTAALGGKGIAYPHHSRQQHHHTQRHTDDPEQKTLHVPSPYVQKRRTSAEVEA